MGFTESLWDLRMRDGERKIGAQQEGNRETEMA